MNKGFVCRSWEMLTRMAVDLKDAPPLLVGVATPNPADMGRPLFNSAVLLREAPWGRRFTRRCCPLTTSSTRTATSNRRAVRKSLNLGGWRLGISICEDVWNDRDFWQRRRYHQDPIEGLGASAAHRPSSTFPPRLSPSGSSFCANRCWATWPANMACRWSSSTRWAATTTSSSTAAAAPSTRRAACSRAPKVSRKIVVVVDLAAGRPPGPAPSPRTISSPEAEIWNALVLGVRDYARKTAFQQSVARAFRRHRFGSHRGHRRRCPGAGKRARRADALALLEPRQRRRFARARPQPRHRTMTLPIAGIMQTYDAVLADRFPRSARRTSPRRTFNRASAATC